MLLSCYLWYCADIFCVEQISTPGQTFLLYVLREEMSGCNVRIRNKMKIQKYLKNIDSVQKHDSLKVVDQTNVRLVSGNDLSIW